MKLSIIICVYNTATDYLAECIRSIKNSTLKEIEGEYEICMVDDGSTLDYSALVDDFGIKYLKTENRGILSARKTGVGMASGEYSIFCDSDDTASFNYHRPMLKKAESTNADIVINDWAFHTVRMRYFAKKDDTIKHDIDLSGDEKLRAFFKNSGRQHSYYVLWNKLYKTSLLKKAFENLENSPYPKNSSYSEDVAINFFAWRDANRIVNIHTGYYFYRIHPTQTVNTTGKEKILRQVECMTACFDLMRSNLGNNLYKSEILTRIDSWSALMSRAHYSAAKGVGYDDIFPVIKEKYGVKKLKRSTTRDANGYIGTELLGTNFTEIDSLLFAIWDSPTVKTVKYKKRDKYTAKCVDFLISSDKAKKTKKANADVVIPPQKSSWRMKIIHNGICYKLGLVFFKKGSRLRNFLKKFI